ncbi:MAG: hypothetical protein R3213_03330 [Flavobacteriaceae bacterium]|nr:hypothetical protein [Flavobacteriaceae bacterium]
MKYFKTLAILLLGLAISFYSCDDNPSSKIKQTKEPLKVSNSATPTNPETPNANTQATSQNASGVYHYTCSNGCDGGADSAVNCANCGLLLVHNQAFHSNPNTESTPAPFIGSSNAETGQNTAGVWHYTCPQGCAGGSGSAGTCGTCGSTLAHNQAYH